MKASFLALIILSTLISCNNGSGGSNNSSSIDACTYGQCSDIKELSVEELKLLFARSARSTRAPEKGLSVSYDKTHISMQCDYAGDYPDIKPVNCKSCKVSYNETSTIVDYDAQYFYYEEKRVATSVSPKIKECNVLIDDEESEYNNTNIIKKDRTDSQAVMKREENEDSNFDKLKIYQLKFNGLLAIKVIAEVITDIRDFDGKDVKAKFSVSAIHELGRSDFTSSLVQTQKMTSDSKYFNSEDTTSNRIIKTGVDVSHIDIDSLNSYEIDDQTEDGNNERNTETNIYSIFR